MTLYRVYRPQQFKDLVGQDHIRTTLTNALVMDFLSHGYLFAGPKGTGKTSTARIFAKALACLTREHNVAEPCNKCDVCREINQGRSLDLIEIDAASNRGIDEIRSLRESVQFLPLKAKRRIFIIDEVHMLTKEAFNALLKTLEEPPAHIVFIMATTEPDKIPLTILSRVQRFDFRRLGNKEIADQLLLVSRQEKIKCAPEAAALIATLAGGSMRDALTIFEKVASRGAVDENAVAESMGLVSFAQTKEFLEHLADKNQHQAIDFLHRYHATGGDVQALSANLIENLRKIMILGVGKEIEPLLAREMSKEELAVLQGLSKKIIPATAGTLIRRLLELRPLIKVSPLPSLPLELLVIEFMNHGSQNVENKT